MALKQLKTLTCHPAVLLELTLSEVWCQLKLVEGEQKACVYHEPDIFGHTFSEVYNFLMQRNLASQQELKILEKMSKNDNSCARTGKAGSAATGWPWWGILHVGTGGGVRGWALCQVP